jgi:hypothetical protein
MKNVVVKVEDGIVQAVYCPDKTYQVHILDDDKQVVGFHYQEVAKYYKDVEEICNELVDCTSISKEI